MPQAQQAAHLLRLLQAAIDGSDQALRHYLDRGGLTDVLVYRDSDRR